MEYIKKLDGFFFSSPQVLYCKKKKKKVGSKIQSFLLLCFRTGCLAKIVLEQ